MGKGERGPEGTFLERHPGAMPYRSPFWKKKFDVGVVAYTHKGSADLEGVSKIFIHGQVPPRVLLTFTRFSREQKRQSIERTSGIYGGVSCCLGTEIFKFTRPQLNTAYDMFLHIGGFSLK